MTKLNKKKQTYKKDFYNKLRQLANPLGSTSNQKQRSKSQCITKTCAQNPKNQIDFQKFITKENLLPSEIKHSFTHTITNIPSFNRKYRNVQENSRALGNLQLCHLIK